MKAMNTMMVMAVLAVGMVATAQDASAQGYVRRTVNGDGFSGGGFSNGGYRRVPVSPRYPIYHDEGNFDGFNSSGGINTSGVTVLNSVNDPYRNMSRFNRSMREVNRPIVDHNGRVVGYEHGRQWINSVTGRVHGEVERVTNNGLGGVDRQAVAYGKSEE